MTNENDNTLTGKFDLRNVVNELNKLTDQSTEILVSVSQASGGTKLGMKDTSLEDDVNTMKNSILIASEMVGAASHSLFGDDVHASYIDAFMMVAAEKIRIIADLWEEHESSFSQYMSEPDKSGFHLSILSTEAILIMIGNYEGNYKLDLVVALDIPISLIDEISDGLERYTQAAVLKRAA